MELPNEISNIICSYIQGPTHKIIYELYFDPYYNCLNPYECLKLNKQYNFKHIHISRLLEAIDTRCPYCFCRLNPQEYLYRGFYEKYSGKKLCIQCLEKERFRVLFELFELLFILLICIIFWGSMLHVISMIEVSH